jgi:hypothetical protein
MIIEYYILSLMRDDRIELVKKNITNFPEFKVFKSINGYDEDKTLDEFKKTGLRYSFLQTPTWGTLANFLTKYKMLEYQIANKIPYVCFIEDDLELLPGFITHVQSCIKYLDESVNIIRLNTWGEGFITSLRGAQIVNRLIQNRGIISNIDNQLRDCCGIEKYCPTDFWNLVSPTNEGDCLKTNELKETILFKISNKIQIDN